MITRENHTHTDKRAILHGINRKMLRAGVRDPWSMITTCLAAGWAIWSSGSGKTVVFGESPFPSPRGASKARYTWVWDPQSTRLWCLEWTPNGVKKWSAPGTADPAQWIEWLTRRAQTQRVSERFSPLFHW